MSQSGSDRPDSAPAGPIAADPDATTGGDGTLPQELLPAAQRVFGDRLPLARRYAHLLATEGVVRGLVGPREAPRIWSRHLLNCAVVAELIPAGSTVVDVGSGAGLPGVVLAIARPDLSVTLVEPLARRCAFLNEVTAALDLANITVFRARAEEAVGRLGPGQIVTARAVAPLDRLATWCLPLAAVGGYLLALKGASAADEAAEHEAAVRRLGGGTPVVRTCGAGVVDPLTTVLVVQRIAEVQPAAGAAGPAVRPKSRTEGRRGGGRRRSAGPAEDRAGGNGAQESDRAAGHGPTASGRSARMPRGSQPRRGRGSQAG